MEPVLEQYRPVILSSLKFSKFTLGTVAPQFTGDFVIWVRFIWSVWVNNSVLLSTNCMAVYLAIFVCVFDHVIIKSSSKLVVWLLRAKFGYNSYQYLLIRCEFLQIHHWITFSFYIIRLAKFLENQRLITMSSIKCLNFKVFVVLNYA